METKEYEFETKEIDRPEIWTEKIDIPVDADPKDFVEKIMVDFNKEEDRRSEVSDKYEARHRKIIRIIEETGIEKSFCDLKKYNNSTIIRGNENYDLMLCKNCGLFRRRFGLGIDFPEKFECFPDHVCKECNKEFKTPKLLQKHMERDNHKIPVWYPDGI